MSKDEFWTCIRTETPVDRPVPVEDAPVEHEAWVVAVLTGDLHMTAEEIEKLTPDEAQRIVNEYWSRPR